MHARPVARNRRTCPRARLLCAVPSPMSVARTRNRVIERVTPGLRHPAVRTGNVSYDSDEDVAESEKAYDLVEFVADFILIQSAQRITLHLDRMLARTVTQ